MNIGFRLIFAFLVVSLFGCRKPDLENRQRTNDLKSTTAADSDSSTSSPKQYALLVGCTKYDNLPSERHLRGGLNDVKMMKRMLVERFKFPEKNICMLTEAESLTNRPLRRNIEREMRNLAQKAKSGDRVVIFLSGHGSQQPNNAADDDDDLEPDGMDEVFCPADTEVVIDSHGMQIPNVITDDEFRDWIGKILVNQASVWFIVDACNSGTMTRGTKTYRQIPPHLLLSKKVLQESQNATPLTRSSRQQDTGLIDIVDDNAGLVAIYAAQPHEPTFEVELPISEMDRQVHGVLTYHLVKVLTSSDETITYSELLQRIHSEYAALGLRGPTPLIEGADRHREVLGVEKWPSRSRLALLREHGRSKLKLNAGSLHGLTSGTILAVYPPPGKEQGEEPLGYVRVLQTSTIDADVRPIEHSGKRAVWDLPLGGRCEIVYLDYGDMKLRVALDESAKGDNELVTRLLIMATKDRAVISVVDEAADADWIVNKTEAGQIELMPADGWIEQHNSETTVFGPASADDNADEWLEERFGRIARATSLRKVCAKTVANSKRSLVSKLLGLNQKNVRVKLLRLSDQGDGLGAPIKWKEGRLVLKSGDLIAAEVSNESDHAIDISMLFINSDFGIEHLFPPPNTVGDNRILPGGSLVVGPMQVEPSSVGLEHLVVISMTGEGQPVDFSWLAQDSIERMGATRSGHSNGADSPLGTLLQQAMFARGNTRGIGTADVGSVNVDLLSWHTSK